LLWLIFSKSATHTFYRRAEKSGTAAAVSGTGGSSRGTAQGHVGAYRSGGGIGKIFFQYR